MKNHNPTRPTNLAPEQTPRHADTKDGVTTCGALVHSKLLIMQYGATVHEITVEPLGSNGEPIYGEEISLYRTSDGIDRRFDDEFLGPAAAWKSYQQKLVEALARLEAKLELVLAAGEETDAFNNRS